MSRSIDNKVVSMEFDNSKFEKPAKESISTLDKLKEALHFKNVESGFNAMNTAIKKVTFDPLTKGIDSVYAKFTFFERFTIQLYDRLANKIISTGSMIAKQTFTAPITTGKSEYEEKMGAVQTIMASTGEDLKTVNKYLSELNKYSDDTIYSFRDMTTNIGKFTNAGVKLEDAVAAIKGVSNEAARSGANANEASRAMYNFAQALSTGSVKLIDWKSIENANMATVEFKDELLKTAEALGTVTKTSEGMYKTMKGHAISATKGFNDNLSDAWLTSEVLIETLKKYADETTDIGKASTAAATEVKTFTMLMDTLKEALQSGWAESWEYIFGDFEKAKKLWTDLSKVLGGLIERMSTTRNAILKVWNEIGGRDAMLKSFSNMWKALTTVLGAVRDGFRTVFPPKTGKDLADLTKRFERFTRSLKPAPETIDKLRRTFAGLFSMLAIVGDAFRAFANAILPLVRKALGFITGELLGGTRSLGNWVVNLRASIKEGRVFENVFGKVGSVLAWVGSKLKVAFLALKDIILAFKNGGIKAGFTAIKDAFVDLFSYLWDFLKKHNPVTFIKEVGVKIGEAIYNWPVGKAIVDFVKGIRDAIVNSSVWKFCVGVIEDFVHAIQAAINKFRGIDTSATEEFTENVKEGFHPLEAIKNFFVKIWHGILAVWEVIGPAIKTVGKFIANAFSGLFATIKGILDRSDIGDVGTALAGGGLGFLVFELGSIIKSLRGTVVDLGKISKRIGRFLGEITNTLKAVQTGIKAKAFKELAIGIILLAGALFVLSGLPEDRIYKSTAALVLLITSVTGVLGKISNSSIGEGGGGKAAALVGMGAQLLMVAAAITVLIADLALLSLLPYNNMLKGIAALLLLLRAVTAEALKFAGKDVISPKVLAVFLGLGTVINMMTLSLAAITGLVALSPEATLTAAGILVALIGFVGILVKEMSEVTTSYDKNGAKIKKSSASFAPLFASLLVLLIGTKKVLIAMLAVAAAIKFLGPGAVAGATTAMIVIMGAVVGAVLAIQAIMWKYMQGTRKDIVVKMASFALIMAGIAAVVMAIGASVAIIGLLPKEKIEAVTGLLTSIVLAIGLIVIAIKEINKRTARLKIPSKKDTGKLSRGLETLKNMAVLMAAMSLAVIGVASAAVLISKADTESLNKAMGVFIAIAALIGVVSYMSQGAGGSTVLATIRYLGVVAAAFAVAVALLTVAFKTLSTMTEEEVRKTINNLNLLVDDLDKNSFKYGTAIGLFIGNVIAAIVSSLGASAVQIGSGLIDMINGVLDVVLEKGPAFFGRIWDMIAMILSSIRERAGEITMRLVEALIAIIDGLATAIGEHRSEIVEAVNKLFEEVIKTVVQLLARLLGVSKENLEDFADYVLPWAKRISLALIGIFAYKKMKSAADKTFTIFGNLKNKFKEVADSVKNSKLELTKSENGEWVEKGVGTLKDYFYMWKTGIKNTVTQAKTGLSTVFGKIKGIVAAHPLMTALVVVTAGLKVALDVATKNIEVISKETKETAKLYDNMQKAESEYQSIINKREEAYKQAQEEYNSGTLYLEQLRKCVDAQGYLVKGKEDEFLVLQKKIAPYLSVALDETTKRVTAEDEYGRKLDITSQKLGEIYKKRMLQKQLEAAMAASEEAYQKIQSGELDNAIANAYDELENAKKRTKELMDPIGFDPLIMTYEEMSKISDISSFIKHLETDVYNMTMSEKGKKKLRENINEAKQYIRDYQEAYDSAISNRSRYQQMANNFEMVSQATNKSAEEMQRVLNIVNANVVTKEAGASLVDLEKQAASTYEQITKAAEAGILDPKKYKAALDLLIPQIKSFGEEASSEFLKSIGWTGDYESYMASFTSMEKALKRTREFAEEMGIQDVSGLIAGIKSEKGRLFDEWEDLSMTMVALYAHQHGIESPSRVFKQYGIYDVLGLINGVTSKEGALEKTYSAMAASNIAAYTSAMTKSTSSIPFTPVVNTSGIQNGTKILQGKLNGLAANPIGATLTSRLAASVDTSQMDIDNSRIVSSISDLKRGLSDLGDRIEKLQIVMDTGATVGALAPGMDMELGRRASRKQRGV